MSIRKELVSGVFWSAVEKYSSAVVSLIVSAILARLLTPADFGTVSLVTVIITFLSIFSNLGIAPAIIQFSLDKDKLNSIFSFTIALGCILSAIMFLSAPLIAKFYGDSQLILLCRILSVNLFFVSMNLVPNSLMLKNKRFKLIAKRSLSLNIISGIIAIIAALKGLGIYSLLIHPIVFAIGIFIYNFHYYPLKPILKIDFSSLKSIFSYSIFQFLFEFVNFFSRNFDKLIIGKAINLDQLGYYDKSYRLMLLPLQYVSMIINPVLQPVLSHLQNDMSSMREKYNKLIRILALISFPLSVLLFFSAHDLINIIFGNQWEAAIPCFKILCLSLPIQLITSTAGAIFQSSNATKLMFFVGIRNTIFTISGICIGAFVFNSIEAVAWAWDITLIINFLTSYNSIYKRLFHKSSIEVYRNLLIPFLLSCILVIFMILFTNAYTIENIILSFATKTLLVFAIYLSSYSIIMKKSIIQIIKTVKELKK